jgi:hypothetical protein
MAALTGRFLLFSLMTKSTFGMPDKLHDQQQITQHEAIAFTFNDMKSKGTPVPVKQQG